MNKKYDEKDRESILNYAKTLDGKSLNMALMENAGDDYVTSNKGALGHNVESKFFGYDLNSNQDADFPGAKLEVKSIPIKRIKKSPNSEMCIKREGLSVKERIVLSMINFNDIIDETWETTALHKKLDYILMMFYEYQKGIHVDDSKFIMSRVWSPFIDDLPYIQKDWEFIQSKIKDGKAHELSEGDTLLLGACTKGKNKDDVREQPNNDIPAMRRAYSLKRSYADYIFNTIYSKDKESVQSIPVSIYDDILNNFNQICNCNLHDLQQRYNIQVNRSAKQFLASFTSKLFEKIIGMSVKNFNENNVAGIEIKTILMNSNNKVKESMSFEQINYDELVNEDWEVSKFKSKFESKKMLWIVYKSNRVYDRQSELLLDEINLYGLFYWNVPYDDLNNDIKLLWEDTVEKVKNKDFNNFKKISETNVAHIRPKAKNNDDTITLADGTVAPRKTYWLNAKYVTEQIKKNLQSNN